MPDHAAHSSENQTILHSCKNRFYNKQSFYESRHIDGIWVVLHIRLPFRVLLTRVPYYLEALKGNPQSGIPIRSQGAEQTCTCKGAWLGLTVLLNYCPNVTPRVLNPVHSPTPAIHDVHIFLCRKAIYVSTYADSSPGSSLKWGLFQTWIPSESTV